MSVLSFVFDQAKDLIGDLTGKQPAKGVGKTSIGVMELDACISESHQFKSDVTILPIENGANMADHIISQPITLSIEGFITNSPVSVLGASTGTVIGNFIGNALGGGGGITSALGGVIGGTLLSGVGDGITKAIGDASQGNFKAALGDVISGFTGGPSNSTDYVQNSYKQLMAIRDKKVPIAIVTSLNVYINMVMTSLSIPRSRQVGDALQFTAEFVQIKKVSSQEVTIPNAQVADQAAGKSDAGRQNPVEPSADTASKSSLLYKLVH